MLPPEPASYCLTPRALGDLEDIWRHPAGLRTPIQADKYVDALLRVVEAVAGFPILARERPEFTPPVRIHVHETHLIVYAIAEDHVAILRLLDGRQDWLAMLKAGDP